MKLLLNHLILIFLLLVLTTTYASAQTNKVKKTEDLISPPTKSQYRKKLEIEWGDWNQINTSTKYGVGIKGVIESELSQLDKSSLLNNATGVAVSTVPIRSQLRKPSKPKDIKKMIEELELLEAELTKELNDDTEF